VLKIRNLEKKEAKLDKQAEKMAAVYKRDGKA